MADRTEMRKTQSMIAVTEQQADRIKAIAKKWKHAAATDTIELLLNAYDKQVTPDGK